MSRGTLFGALLASLAVSAASASADQSAPTWNCRASVLQLFGTSAQPRFEPLVANGDGTTGADRPACADDREGLPELASPADSPFKVSVQGPYSATAITPAIADARDQTAYAGTKTGQVSVATPNGELTITAQAIRAEAAAHCVNGAPSFDGSSTVLDLRVNGTPLPLDDTTVGQITQQVSDSPLGGLITVRINQKAQTTDGLTVQAARIELFSAAGSPQGTIILGEAKVTKQGDTCAPAQPATSTTGNDGTNGTNGTNGATGANGTNGTNGTNSTTPGTTGSGTTVVKKVVINGRNGGCGRIKVWFEKVDLLHRLPGRPMKATSRFGNRVLIRGRLISCAGKPIVGARLTQIHYVGGGIGRLLKTGVKTRANGKFTYIEPLNLTTRRIVFVYRGNLASPKASDRKVLRLTVRNRQGKVLRGHPPRTLE